MRAGELLDAAAQAAEAQQARGFAEPGAQFVAQAGKEKQFKAAVGITREVAEIGFENLPSERLVLVRVKGQTEVAQDFFQREGEFADGDGLAVKFGLEIVEHGGGGVPEHVRIDHAVGVADDLDGDHLRRAGDALAVGELENQVVGC